MPKPRSCRNKYYSSKVEVRGIKVRKLTKVDTTPSMKNIIQATKDIREEARGTVMQERVRAVVEDLIKDLKDNIADEVGNLIGELITNFIYEGSEIELELTDYAFNRINDALLSEIKNRSNDHGLKCILQAYGTPWRRHSKSLQSGAPASSTTESRKSDDCLL